MQLKHPVARKWFRLIGLFQRSRWAIGAPSPPGRATFAMIEFLPFTPMRFSEDGRTAIDPDLLRFISQVTAARAAKLTGVNRPFSPVR